MTAGGKAILSELPYSFAAKVLRPWELDKILDSSINEDTNLPFLPVESA